VQTMLLVQTPANLGLHSVGGRVLRSNQPHRILARKDPSILAFRGELATESWVTASGFLSTLAWVGAGVSSTGLM